MSKKKPRATLTSGPIGAYVICVGCGGPTQMVGGVWMMLCMACLVTMQTASAAKALVDIREEVPV